MQDIPVTNLNDFFEELNDGLLKPLFEKLVSTVSLETMVHGSKKSKGSIQLNFRFEPHQDIDQIVINTKMTYQCPTIKGKRSEEITGTAAFYVGKGGQLSTIRTDEDYKGQLDMFGKQ